MLFENEKEVREFAKVLARKMLDRRPLSEWRKLAKVITDSPTAGLSDLYAALLGYNRDPIPSSAYREALNKMHFAVNGIKPYADGGEDEEDPQPCSAHSCNGTYDAAAYGERGEYEVCNGDQNAGYSSLRPCPVLTEPWSCSGVFKCVANFNCANNIFTCARVFWQNDQGCPGGDVYRCGTTQDHKTHACNEKTATFRCKKGDLGGEDDYDFLNTYACSESYTKCENWANFACDGQRFLCQSVRPPLRDARADENDDSVASSPQQQPSVTEVIADASGFLILANAKSPVFSLRLSTRPRKKSPN